MAKKTKPGPAAAALGELIDREIERGLVQLKIRSRAAFQREWYRFQELCPQCAWDDELEYVARPIRDRAVALSTLDALDRDGRRDGQLETLDEWIIELRELLPTALTRPLTKEEMRETRAAVDKADAEEEIRREEQRIRWEQEKIIKARPARRRAA